jgi:outer membrane protein assembly factor BamB
VFVVVPTGYRASGAFHRLVRPDDGPSREHSFGLAEDAASRSPDFSFLAGSDIQYGLAAERANLEADFREMADLARDAAFAVFAGDLTPTGDLEDLKTLKRVADEIWRKPFHAGFGGHDGNNPTRMGNYTEVFGPSYYSWDYGGRHFVALVSEVSYMDAETVERQFRWLHRDAALQPPGKPLYVICHTPEGIEPHLKRLAAERGLRAVVRGHVHVNTVYEAEKRIPVICTAPYRAFEWGAFTRRCRVVSLRGDEITSSTRVLGQTRRLIVTSPPPGGFVTPGPVLVQANAYDTARCVAAASYRLAGPDGVQATGTMQPHADWSWWAEWDGRQAAPGTWTLTIEVRDEAGETWRAETAFEVATEAGPTARPGGDWPSLLGAEHRSRAVERMLSPPLRLVWIGRTGGVIPGFASPVVADGKVVVGVADGEVRWQRAGVACFDAATGRPLWKTRTEADVFGTVAVSDGKVFALTTSGGVQRLDLGTGRAEWSRNVYGDPGYGWAMAPGPVFVAGGRVFAVPDMWPAVCLDLDGGESWRARAGGGYHRTAGLAVFDGRGYTSDENACISLDPDSGRHLWRTEIPRARGMSTPVVYGDRAYFAHNDVLRALRKDTGEEIWKVRIGGSKCPGVPVEHAGRVIVTSGTSGAAVCAFEASSGRPLWKRPTNEPDLFRCSRWQVMSESSSPAVAGDYVFVGSDNGTFYVLAASSGEVAWRYHVGAPIKSSPAISGNMIYFAAFDGNVYALAATERPPTPGGGP